MSKDDVIFESEISNPVDSVEEQDAPKHESPSLKLNPICTPVESKKRGRKPRLDSLKPLKASSVETVRKHSVINCNRNNLAQLLDSYAAEGRVVIALNISLDIGGSYEVVSYKNEPVN
jgi:hypothetical protein